VVFGGVYIGQFLVFSVVFSGALFVSISFGHCIVWPSSI